MGYSKMSKIQNENFIVVCGWMINDLKLKGNDLLIYACIYGLSQTEQQCFTGSLQYLADWANCTKQGVIKNLKSLLDRGYITKKEYEKNGIKFCEYKAVEFNGIKQSLMGGIQQSLPNNIEQENIEKKKVKKKSTFVPPTFEEVQAYATEKGRIDLAQRFYDYYTATDWIKQNGEAVKNWQLTFKTWIGRNPVTTNNADKPKQDQTQSTTVEWVQDETGVWKPKL